MTSLRRSGRLSVTHQAQLTGSQALDSLGGGDSWVLAQELLDRDLLLSITPPHSSFSTAAEYRLPADLESPHMDPLQDLKVQVSGYNLDRSGRVFDDLCARLKSPRRPL